MASHFPIEAMLAVVSALLRTAIGLRVTFRDLVNSRPDAH